MSKPTEKPIAFRFKSAETKAAFASYMEANGLNANSAANRLIEDGLLAQSRPATKIMNGLRDVQGHLDGDASRVVDNRSRTYTPRPDTWDPRFAAAKKGRK